MVLAMPMRKGKISAYLDLAESLLLVRIEGGRECSRESIAIEDKSLVSRVYALAELAVDVLVCGATSREVPEMLAKRRIGVIPGIRGEPDPVVAAYLSGLLPHPHDLKGGVKQGQSGDGAWALSAYKSPG